MCADFSLHIVPLIQKPPTTWVQILMTTPAAVGPILLFCAGLVFASGQGVKNICVEAWGRRLSLGRPKERSTRGSLNWQPGRPGEYFLRVRKLAEGNWHVDHRSVPPQVQPDMTQEVKSGTRA